MAMMRDEVESKSDKEVRQIARAIGTGQRAIPRPPAASPKKNRRIKMNGKVHEVHPYTCGAQGDSMLFCIRYNRRTKFSCELPGHLDHVFFCKKHRRYEEWA